MGCCTSFEADPDAPAVIKPDPPTDQPALFVTARLGYFGMSNDFGVWQNERPEKSQDQKEQLWLWLNKIDQPNEYRIDLENFVRNNPDKPRKGQILYYSLQPKTPQVQFFHRIANSGNHFWQGFLGINNNGNSNPNPDDQHYIARSSEPSTSPDERLISRTVLITKWQSYSTTKIFDGQLGRGEETLKNHFVLLDVLAIGTAVTIYRDVERKITEHDADGREKTRHVREMEKHTSNFVDSVQYRVSVNHLLWATWTVVGDAFTTNASSNVTVTTPFFTTTIEGGWASRTKYKIQTNPNIDPALALLMAHLVCTEYSISELKNDANVSIPHNPPHQQSLTVPEVLVFVLPETTGVYVN